MNGRYIKALFHKLKIEDEKEANDNEDIVR